jgi:pyridine nucleotide-disulfide oxidoreductase family protein
MKRLLLVGAGHAHAQVLLDMAKSPLPGVEVTVVSPHSLAPYSGMVPGWLAGIYTFDEIVIDFSRLCAAAGARWIQGELDSLDTQQRKVRLNTGKQLGYDILSLNVGSTLQPQSMGVAQVLSLRPLSELRSGFESLLERWQSSPSDGDFTVTAVGGGAAGFESLLAVLQRLRTLQPQRRVHGHLVTRGATLLPGVSAIARRVAASALEQAGIQVQLGADWSESTAAAGDLVLWATGAQALAWQTDPARNGGLAVSSRGFIRVDDQLRSVSHPQVFAVGDCCEWANPLPKAGVYAVRMGPVLLHNLRAALGVGGVGVGRPFHPQHQFLVLLATGKGRAIASRGVLGAEGRWVWRWKNHIDRSFVHRFAIGGASD